MGGGGWFAVALALLAACRLVSGDVTFTLSNGTMVVVPSYEFSRRRAADITTILYLNSTACQFISVPPSCDQPEFFDPHLVPQEPACWIIDAALLYTSGCVSPAYIDALITTFKIQGVLNIFLFVDSSVNSTSRYCWKFPNEDAETALDIRLQTLATQGIPEAAFLSPPQPATGEVFLNITAISGTSPWTESGSFATSVGVGCIVLFAVFGAFLLIGIIGNSVIWRSIYGLRSSSILSYVGMAVIKLVYYVIVQVNTPIFAPDNLYWVARPLFIMAAFFAYRTYYSIYQEDGGWYLTFYLPNVAIFVIWVLPMFASLYTPLVFMVIKIVVAAVAAGIALFDFSLAMYVKNRGSRENFFQHGGEYSASNFGAVTATIWFLIIAMILEITRFEKYTGAVEEYSVIFILLELIDLLVFAFWTCLILARGVQARRWLNTNNYVEVPLTNQSRGQNGGN